MTIKDKIAVVVSMVALSLSIWSTAMGEARAAFEKERSLKAELSATLSKIMELNKEGATLFRDYNKSEEHAQFLQVQSGNISQENTFLIHQAMYIAEKIPDMVTPVELNTIAAANANVGDLPAAERYYLLAIDGTNDPYYASLAIRSYAGFLYPQRRFEEGRKRFQEALARLPGGDNFVRGVNGYTYQMWAFNEMSFANNRSRAVDLFRESHNEFVGIDNIPWRANLLKGLDAAIRASTDNAMSLGSVVQANNNDAILSE